MTGFVHVRDLICHYFPMEIANYVIGYTFFLSLHLEPKEILELRIHRSGYKMTVTEQSQLHKFRSFLFDRGQNESLSFDCHELPVSGGFSKSLVRLFG